MTKLQLIENAKCQFENIYYLRPENFVYSFLRSKACIENYNSKSSNYSLDIGCGDGVFSFITYGGKFDPNFDVFKDINYKALRLLFAFKTNDIYGQSINHKNTNYKITKKPNYKLSYATELNKKSLNKAKKLKIYKKIYLHDSNKPFNIESDSMDYIYTNSIYYVKDIESHLKELHRIIKPGGLIIAQIKTSKFKKIYPYDKGLFKHWSTKAVKLLDRNVYNSVLKNLKPLKDWEKLIKKHHFKVTNEQNVCSKHQALFWLYGIRYLSPFLIYLFNKLNEKDRFQLKNEFINYTKPITYQILKDTIQDKDTYEVTFCLTK